MKILFLLFLQISTYGQHIYKGDIINNITKEKIPFATVGLIKENIGTNADENGKFSLTSKSYANDTLAISCVGYETVKFPIDKLPENMLYGISEKQIFLKTVVLSNSYKRATLNDFSNCGLNSYTSSGAVTQIAEHFRSPAENSLLTEINICKQGDNCIFRIRIYDMDTITGMPSTDLADTVLEVKSGERHVNIDLESYKIVIPKRDFFIAIEWLYIESNANKVKVKLNGQKRTYLQYSPYIFFKERNGDRSDPGNLRNWQLDYRGKWFPVAQNWQMLISANIKYQQ